MFGIVDSTFLRRGIRDPHHRHQYEVVRRGEEGKGPRRNRRDREKGPKLEQPSEVIGEKFLDFRSDYNVNGTN